MKTTIKDIDVCNKKVLLRLDFNVPIDAKTGEISDATRVMESLATINYLCERGAKVIICSHLGRPNGETKKEFSLEIVANLLARLVKNKVVFATDTVGKDAKQKVDAMKSGEIVVLENLRFDKREEECDDEFAKSLASLADVFVLDAFGTAHRKHASTYGVSKFLPSAVGLLIKKELKAFSNILDNPQRPLVAVLGGAKIADKIPVIENLLERANVVLVGGGMAYTFVKALGGNVGKSLVDEEKLELAKSLVEKAKQKNVTFVLPVDNVCNFDIDNLSKPKVFASDCIPDEYMGLDIGPKTVKMFISHIKHAGTVVWNGPMGVFEQKVYAKGTNKIAKAVAKSHAYTFVGGGDSASAIVKSGYSKKINHLSTGGGASLMLLEGRSLPCVDAICDVKEKKA